MRSSGLRSSMKMRSSPFRSGTTKRSCRRGRRTRAAVRVRGRSRPMFRLQGLRGRLPQPQRAGRGRVVARCRPGDRRRPELPVLQHVTTACHHCLDPACLNACPVDAYEKDPVTGIVRHLDDQCFGCQYCTLACPYDAPSSTPARALSASATCAATGWPRARLPLASRLALTRRSAFALWTARGRRARPRPGASCRAGPTPGMDPAHNGLSVEPPAGAGGLQVGR